MSEVWKGFCKGLGGIAPFVGIAAGIVACVGLVRLVKWLGW